MAFRDFHWEGLMPMTTPSRTISCTLVLFWLGALITMSIADNNCYRCIGNKLGSDFYVTWSNRNVKSPDDGRTIQLSLDYNSGSAIGTNKKYLYGYFSAQIKLVAGDSAGTLATFYLALEQAKHTKWNGLHSSFCATVQPWSKPSIRYGIVCDHDTHTAWKYYARRTANLLAWGTIELESILKTTDTSPVHDELDFEFLGNSSGQPYALQTNVFAANSFGREQRISLWFDPTADFHQYSFLWNRHIIIFLVDSTIIRIFPNDNRLQVPYVYNPMRLYATIYNADDWVTKGGKVKIDWRNAPFQITLRDIKVEGCPVGEMTCSQSPNQEMWWDQPQFWSLGATQMAQLKYIKKRYMIYNYCTDIRRYPKLPAECINS